MKKYKVGIVGIGAVGTELVKVLRQRNFPTSELRILARTERDEVVAGETFHVVPTTPEAFDGLDLRSSPGRKAPRARPSSLAGKR